MTSRRGQFLNGVDQAVLFTTGLLKTQRQHYETDIEAIDAVSGQTRLTPSVLRKFLQPSRRPKAVDFDVVGCLRRAYLRMLNQQLDALRTEIAVVEALGAREGAVSDLLDEAKALVGRIEALTESQPITPQERPHGDNQRAEGG